MGNIKCMSAKYCNLNLHSVCNRSESNLHRSIVFKGSQNTVRTQSFKRPIKNHQSVHIFTIQYNISHIYKDLLPFLNFRVGMLPNNRYVLASRQTICRRNEKRKQKTILRSTSCDIHHLRELC